jgi:hypothetical protein
MVAWVVLQFPGSTRNETVLVLNLSWFVIALGNIHTSRYTEHSAGRSRTDFCKAVSVPAFMRFCEPAATGDQGSAR